MIKTNKIYKSFDSLQVLRGLSMEVEKSQVVAIVGASGAGKSTLLHILSTLDHPDQGEVYFGSVNPFSLSPKALAAFRNKNIGFVFQFHNLLPEFSAIENVMIPGYIAGTSSQILKQKANELLQKLGVADRASHRPSELSGGEAQRVAVARALINSPQVIFADEPSGNLDSENADHLHQLFFKLRDEFEHTFVIVTHNKEFAAMGDRTFTMKDGHFI